MPKSKLALVLYYRSILPSRNSLSDHLDSFRQVDGHRVIFFNLAFFRLPKFFANIDFSVIVYHYTLCGLRFNRERFKSILYYSHQTLAQLSGFKVAYPQDEFAHMDLMCDLINTYKIDHVFTVSPLTEVPKIYKTIDHSLVTFSRVLTGYISQKSLSYVNKSNALSSSRPLHFFYRAVVNPAWGSFNLLKERLATLFVKFALEHSVPADIKVGEKYLISGNAWLDALLASKFTFGCEGGASVLDWDGSYSHYLHTISSQDGANLLPPLYEDISIRALSPRHLDAALTKTCQILVKGTYNGVLEPWIHYIPINEDFSDFDVVVRAMENDSLVNRIVANAYRDLVESGLFFYSSLIRILLGRLNELPRCSDYPTVSPLVIFRAQFISFFYTSISNALAYVYNLSKLLSLKLSNWKE